MPLQIKCSAPRCSFLDLIDLSDKFKLRKDGTRDVAQMRDMEKTLAYNRAWLHREAFKGIPKFESHISISHFLPEGTPQNPERK